MKKMKYLNMKHPNSRQNIIRFLRVIILLASLLLAPIGATIAFLMLLQVFFKIFFTGRLAAILIICTLLLIYMFIFPVIVTKPKELSSTRYPAKNPDIKVLKT